MEFSQNALIESNDSAHPYQMEPVNETDSIENCTAALDNLELWQRFHNYGNEMILTKTGRRMFPSLSIRFKNLVPTENYCVFIEMALATPFRYRYHNNKWNVAGRADAQSPKRIYFDGANPSSGRHWMQNLVPFDKCKLTNFNDTLTLTMDDCLHGQLVLTSMHLYQPKIHLVRTSNVAEMFTAPSKVFTFVEAQFFAVTSYQAREVINLKINHNPYAKGFRETGRGRLKNVKNRVRNENKTKSDRCEPAKMDNVLRPITDVLVNQSNTIAHNWFELQRQNLICQTYLDNVKFDRYWYELYNVSSPMSIASHSNCCQCSDTLNVDVEDLRVKKTEKRISDFSIRTIIGERD